MRRHTVATMMIQREEELRWLTAALRTSRRGAGVVVAVEGAAGSGKTRFLQEARRLVKEGDGHVLATRALESERSVHGAVIRRLCGRGTDSACHGRDDFMGRVTALAADRPLLIAVDDAEHCDRESLRTLAALALQLDQVGGVALMLARRPDARHAGDAACLAALVGDPAAVRIRLRALDRAGVAEMIAATAGRAPEPD